MIALYYIHYFDDDDDDDVALRIKATPPALLTHVGDGGL